MSARDSTLGSRRPGPRGITVDPGTVRAIVDRRGSFTLQITDASDARGAVTALRLARVDLLGLASESDSARGAAARQAQAGAEGLRVSPVVPFPGGPIVLVEGDLDQELLRAVPGLVVARLREAGLKRATVGAPPADPILERLERTPRAAILRLFPVPGRGVPPTWIELAADWVAADLAGPAKVQVRVLSVGAAVPAAEVAGTLHECAVAGAWCDAVSGDVGERVRTASLTFGRLPHLALAAGGPAVDGNRLVARAELLCGLAAELAGDDHGTLAYACVDMEETFEGLTLGLGIDGWAAAGGADPNQVARELLTERVPDAYAYQLLGPGHVERLGRTLPEGSWLGPHLYELRIGELNDWLPGTQSREDVRAGAWDILEPLLVHRTEEPILLATSGGRPALDHEGPVEIDDALLDAIVLDPAPHARRGTRLTLLELAAWLHHDAHSDDPPSVPPTVAAFVRWWAAGLDDDARQALKPLARRLSGHRADARSEHERQWVATRWLVLDTAPRWLRTAGLVPMADRIATCIHLEDDAELVRAVDLLGESIRLLGAPADEDELVEEHVWAAWEGIAERTGWSAASEAATVGVPPELVYVTDQRVIECSRDARALEELASSGRSIADAAWMAALGAMADESWDRGWRAADEAARELSGFTVRVELGRVAKTTLRPRSIGVAAGDFDDAEAGELALEAADRAARDALSKAVLRGGTTDSGAHPWDEALGAAATSAGGRLWSAVLDEVRRIIGVDAWAQAVADARAECDRLLPSAPDAVARAVAVALAREAAGAAARATARRAALAAWSEGKDPAPAIAAAVEPVASELQSAAGLLLETLLDP